jgi:predicted RNA-binding Zn ribbon-like protein
LGAAVVSALRLAPEHAAWARLAAELVNTRPRATDPAEKLVDARDAERLLAAAPDPPPAATARDLDGLRALREQLLRAFEAETLEEFARAVNPLLEGTAWRVGRSAGGEWALGTAVAGPPAAWFGAHAARGLAELATTYGIERLHMCSADDCLCAVADVSRNGARRYCSRTCANRTNVRRHRANRR